MGGGTGMEGDSNGRVHAPGTGPPAGDARVPGGSHADGADGDSHRSHTHDHRGADRDPDARLDRRLWLSTALNLAITIAEVVGAVFAGSLALAADAAHNLSDVGALVLAIIARRIGRRPASPRFTYGLKRVEVFAALVNAGVLLGVAVFIALEALRRLSAPTPVSADTMLVVAVFALAGNLVSVLLLKGHHHHDLNVRSAVLHLLQDALASVAVIVAALFVETAAGPWLDPAASLLICLAVLRSAGMIVWEALHLLVEAAPRDLDVGALAAAVGERFAPAALHHVHVWEVGPGQRALTAHIAIENTTVDRAENLCAAVRAYLHDAWGIAHATLEPECEGCGEDSVVAGGAAAGNCFGAGGQGANGSRAAGT